ncbi:MAG: hypothetical protein ACI81P_000650 [Neolewinella sp.]|jgi:hypothetical protein
MSKTKKDGGVSKVRLAGEVQFPQAGDWLFGCQGVQVAGSCETECWYIFLHKKKHKSSDNFRRIP